MNNLYIELKNILERESKRHEFMKNEMKRLPRGNLIIKKTGNHMFLYKKEGKSEQAITRDKDLCMLLARKCFLNKQLSICNQNCGVLNDMLEILKNKKNMCRKHAYDITYERLDDYFDKREYMLSHEQLQWMKHSCRPSGFMQENLRYRTISGIMVRSKSEKIIADFLTRRGIPYGYETGLEINGRVYRPDFTLLKNDGTTVIWEHLGLADDEEYILKINRKLSRYRRAGYSIFTNLICTYEEDIENERNLDIIIKKYYFT